MAACVGVGVVVSPRVVLLGSRCRKLSWNCSDCLLHSNELQWSPSFEKKAALISRIRRKGKRLKVLCRIQEGEDNNKSNGEEPPESLFMKELKRRGMSPTSVLKDNSRSVYEQEELKFKEDKSYAKRSAVSTNIERDLSNQRERSMQLNSEGLEGLVPRAKLLLTLGGTFFLAFWPLAIITLATFSALYSYFGASFVHDGSNMTTAPPPYIDPYALLDEERTSQLLK